MAKALFGTVASPSQLRLLDEIRALRRRVAELEAALEHAGEAAEAAQQRDVVVHLDDDKAGVGA